MIRAYAHVYWHARCIVIALIRFACREHALCIDAGNGDEADRRPPVWRAVVRPARYFCASVLCP